MGIILLKVSLLSLSCQTLKKKPNDHGANHIIISGIQDAEISSVERQALGRAARVLYQKGYSVILRYQKSTLIEELEKSQQFYARDELHNLFYLELYIDNAKRAQVSRVPVTFVEPVRNEKRQPNTFQLFRYERSMAKVQIYARLLHLESARVVWAGQSDASGYVTKRAIRHGAENLFSNLMIKLEP